MSEFIAVDGMATYTKASGKHLGDICQTGSWAETSLVVTKGTKISVDNKMCEVIAVGTFTYSGGTIPNPPSGCATSIPQVPPIIVEVVTLVGTSTKLLDNSTDIMRLGDEQEGVIDSGGTKNKVWIDSGQTKLKSA